MEKKGKGVEVFRVEGLEVKVPAFNMKVDVSVTVNSGNVMDAMTSVTSAVVRGLLAQVLQSLRGRIGK